MSQIVEDRELPASVAFLSKESVDLFTKYRSEPGDSIHIGTAKDGRFLVRIQGSYTMQYVWPNHLPEKQKVESYSSVSWLMPCTDTFALALSLAWNEDQIVFTDEQAKAAMDVLFYQLSIGNVCAYLQAQYKINKEVPNHEMYYNAELPPTDYQQVACYCALSGLDGFALLMKQGTGKTPIIIQYICNQCEEVLNNEGRMYRAIVVCPNAVRMNWEEEVKRFSTHNLRTTVIRGTHMERVRQFCEAFKPGDEHATVVIIGFDTLSAIWPMIKDFQWDLAALDESHSIKSPRTKRTKVCLSLRDQAKKRMIATGTEVANTPLDLYTQLEFLGKGYSGFSSWKAFSNFYGKFRIDPTHGSVLVGEQKNRLPILQERLARISFRISLQEALPELPGKVYDIVECEMTPEQEELYKKVASEVKIEIDREMGKEDGLSKTMVVNNILTLLLKLSQVTSGHVNFPEIIDENGQLVQQRYTHIIADNPKIAALKDLMEPKEPHEKTLIWACYRQDIRTIMAALKEMGMDGMEYYGENSDSEREESVYRYNFDPKCRFLVGNPGAGGVGLNLLGYPPHTKDPSTWTNHAIYFSQDWSYIKRDQSESRGHRRGTIEHVRITDLVIPGTIDVEIRAKVMEKKTLAESVADLGPLLKRVLGV